jgi:spermidine synthase
MTKVLLFAGTSFLSAFLIFLIQPMISKTLLPYLGGGAQIWNTALMVFQLLLLAGYAYAYTLIRLAPWRLQFVIHAVLYAIVIAVFLPLNVDTLPVEGASARPIEWMLSVLFSTVAMPFFTLAATAPLIQYWFGHSGDKACNPYPLYSASNAGSLLALLSYPLWIEWQFDLSLQAKLWSFGLMAFAAALFLTGGHSMREGFRRDIQSSPVTNVAPVTWHQRSLWILFSFLPCSLMMGVTTYVTTDIASVPLLWIVPLMLYLLSLILVFADKPPEFIQRFDKSLLPFSFIIAFCIMTGLQFPELLLLHILLFFMLAVACHREVVKRRPDPRHLGEFYLYMSLGGALGGIFNVILSPQIFTQPVEYPLIIAASLVGLYYLQEAKNRKGDLIAAAGLTAAMSVLLLAVNKTTAHYASELTLLDSAIKIYIPWLSVQSLLTLALCVPVFYFMHRWREHALREAFIVALMLMTPVVNIAATSKDFFAMRNFFGVYRVQHIESSNVHIVMHNTTLHGLQQRDPDKRTLVTSYYLPVKQALSVLPDKTRSHPVMVVGLGVGTLLCAFSSHNHVDTFEIDPDVVALALRTELFSYIQDCPPQKTFIVGDGRLMLAKQPSEKYGIMVFDAFSSDSVPMHLLTSEAFDMYFKKLTADGVLIFHISNRNLDLRPVLAAYAKERNIAAIHGRFPKKEAYTATSEWVVMSRQESQLARIKEGDATWQDIDGVQPVRLWTDQYSNLLSIIK